MKPSETRIPGYNPEEGREWNIEEESSPVLEDAFRSEVGGIIVTNWQDTLPTLMENLADRLEPRLKGILFYTLQKEVALLKNRCSTLERLAPILVPIQTFAPEPYEIVKRIEIIIHFYEDGFLASFFDANISAAGDTQDEAVYNLKDIIVATYEILMNTPEKDLGPGPLQQKRVLTEFIRKKD